MYRKIIGFLEAWRNNEHRKPLILQGARRVGKTYSVLAFGRTHYENVAYFNFETNPKLNETFAENIGPDYLIPILSHIAGQTIVKGKTLIVFDEVQLCERALTSLNTSVRMLRTITSSLWAVYWALRSVERSSPSLLERSICAFRVLHCKSSLRFPSPHTQNKASCMICAFAQIVPLFSA